MLCNKLRAADTNEFILALFRATLTATTHVTGAGLLQLLGYDLTAASNLADGRGCISVVSDVAPRLCADLQRACRDGDFRGAAAMQAQLAPLISALRREINPGPIKLALSLPRPVVSPDLRLSLVASSFGTAPAIAKALAAILNWMWGASGLKPEPLSCAV